MAQNVTLYNLLISCPGDIEGTTFETVYHLYKVDEILRDTFRRYIEKAEVYYRTQIA